MKKCSKILIITLVIAIILPGISDATSVSEEISMKRLSGSGRVQTAIKVSQEVYNTSDSVVLAGFNGEVDALTGTLLANAKDAPLLLTLRDRVHEDLKVELKRLKTKNIYILGGEAAVNKVVEKELEKNYTVKRISGKNREKTAVAVANEVKDQAKHVFLAKGYGVIADALAIGPVSAIKGSPILLTQTDKLPQVTIDAMKSLGVTDVTIVGGEAAISKKVKNQLKDYSVDRISGSNREKTALAIAEEYYQFPKEVLVANGYLFTDALVGGYLGSLLEAPILLSKTNSLDIATKKYIQDQVANQVEKSYILGGNKVISNSVFETIRFPNDMSKEIDDLINKLNNQNSLENKFNQYNKLLKEFPKEKKVKNLQKDLVAELKGKSCYETNIRGNSGSDVYRIYLYADNLKVEKSDVSWAGANKGDKICSGNMKIAYKAEGNNNFKFYKLKQESGHRELNLSHNFVRLIKLDDKDKEFIMIGSTQSSNSLIFELYGIDNHEMKVVNFKTKSGVKPFNYTLNNVYINKLGNGEIETAEYDNWETFAYYYTTWSWNEEKFSFIKQGTRRVDL